MRLFNYLNENTEKYNEMIKQIIDTKCQPFMKEWDGKRLLYRGMTSKYYPYGIKQVRNDRRPLDNKQNVHIFIDKVFEKKFGWKVRSESVFLTGNLKECKRYGNPYVIFPIGKYDYLYSPHIPDLYRSMHTSSNILKPILTDILKNSNVKYKTVDEIFDMHGEEIAQEISTYYKKNVDLNYAISMNIEIMMKCNTYLCIDYDYFRDNEVFIIGE